MYITIYPLVYANLNNITAFVSMFLDLCSGKPIGRGIPLYAPQYRVHAHQTILQSFFCRHAIYANRLYLSLFKERHLNYLATTTAGGPQIIGAVRLHPSAEIHPSAVVYTASTHSYTLYIQLTMY